MALNIIVEPDSPPITMWCMRLPR